MLGQGSSQWVLRDQYPQGKGDDKCNQSRQYTDIDMTGQHAEIVGGLRLKVLDDGIHRSLVRIRGSVLNCLKCLGQILNDIINILGSDRETNCVALDPDPFQFLPRTLRMGRGGGVHNQRLDVSDVGQK